MIRNSRFSNCQTYAIYFTSFVAGHEYNGTITVEDNWFGSTCCYGSEPRESAINLGGAAPGGAVRNLIIRHNTFVPGQTVVAEEAYRGRTFARLPTCLAKAGGA